MHFAEFLNEGFPAHLRILSPPTCVGFGTGACRLVRSFSRQCGPPGFGSPEGLPTCQFSAFRGGDLPPPQPTAFDRLFHPPARAPSCVTPSSSSSMRCRNLRLLSIAYALCLGLGPDLPWGDERCPGSLRLSVGRILTARFATHTGILTSMASTAPSGTASSPMERSPTHACACRDFGSVLEPRIFSAQGLSTSELLRTLSMVAASEPTSWLFLKSYILLHLVQHSGP